MKVALIARSTLFTAKGGDTVQAIHTATHLARYQVVVDIKLTHEKIDYREYDLLHFFNITRPADILYHINKTNKPFVVSPILIDYCEYDRYHRGGIPGMLFSFLSRNSIEFSKTLARWFLGRDKLRSKSYLWKGHRKSVQQILKRAELVLPNSNMEYQRLVEFYKVDPKYIVVPNGVNDDLFQFDEQVQKDPNLILCVARVEGIKNQVNLIKALNNTNYKVLIIGSHAPNQPGYYRLCRKIAAENIFFIDHLPHEALVPYYQRAKVHILPSWFETCGLSTLEAAMTGCNVVVSNKGYTEEYYEDYAFYCDPASPESIRNAVEKAVISKQSEKFRDKISTHYTWSQSAVRTFEAYDQVVKKTGKLRIGIAGTRGIPNHYGGFEQFAEHLSQGLAEKGHEVIVYNSHNHPYQQKKYKKTQIVHCYNPEHVLGSFGQFIYDINAIWDARKKNLDILLMLGYTSSSIWGRFFPADARVIFNMDGLEWKRTKYSKPVQKFLLYAEKLAVRFGDYHIADSKVVRSYFKEKYQLNCEYIPYGATIFNYEDESLLKEYNIKKHGYYILIARMEPENNIETILQGFSESISTKKFLVVGDTRNKYGKYIIEKFSKDSRVQFTGPIYNNALKIHTLKFFSYLYFHGHTVGGTNPSLLEAMASRALIVAHNNAFNKTILNDDAYYFNTATNVKDIIESITRGSFELSMIKNNLRKIQLEYTWEKITQQYEDMMIKCLNRKKIVPDYLQKKELLYVG